MAASGAIQETKLKRQRSSHVSFGKQEEMECKGQTMMLLTQDSDTGLRKKKKVLPIGSTV